MKNKMRLTRKIPRTVPIDPAKRIFNHYNNALIRAQELANETGKVHHVFTNAETGKSHVMDTQPIDTYEEEMDGEMQTFELYINGINVIPQK